MATLTPNGDTEVTVIEQGALTFKSSSVSVTADGTFDIIETVPTGKKWTLKYISVGQNGGTFTITRFQTLIQDTAGANPLKVDDTSASNVIVSLGEKNITLEPTQRIRIATFVTGWSVTGNSTAILVYQEFDS